MSATSSPKLHDLGVIAAAIEGTKGTAETFTAAHGGTEAYNPVWSANLPSAERNPLRPYFDPEKSAPAGHRFYQLNCGVAFKGASAAGALPEWSELMRACGMSETVVASTSVTYAPVSAMEDQKTATIGIYKDGNLFQMAGAMGNCALVFNQGEIGMLEFEMFGKYTAPSATAILAGTELNDVTPPEVDNCTLTYQSVSLDATAVRIDLGNLIAPRRSIAVSGGVRHFYKHGMDVTITVDPEVDPVGTRDFIANIVSGTAGEFVIVVGTTAGNIITVTCPMVQVLQAGPQERDGLEVYSLTLKARVLNPVTGNDSISIALT